MDNDCKTLIKSYKKLFYLTGNIAFFNSYRTMQKTKQAMYLQTDNLQIEL